MFASSTPQDDCRPSPGEAYHDSPFQGVFQRVLGRIEVIEGVDGAVIASRDGLLIAGVGASSERLEMRAALAAAIFGACDRAAGSIDLGPVRGTLVETATRSLQILGLADLLLIVVAAKGANMARVRAGMARAAADLAQHA